jgi:hypothetical protein
MCFLIFFKLFDKQVTAFANYIGEIDEEKLTMVVINEEINIKDYKIARGTPIYINTNDIVLIVSRNNAIKYKKSITF